MKLLFDENLSPRLVDLLSSTYPTAVHISTVNLSRASDSEIWEYAQTQGFTIVSKDSDFHQRSLVDRNPPRVIWIRRGNCSTLTVAHLLIQAREAIEAFQDDVAKTLLILD